MEKLKLLLGIKIDDTSKDALLSILLEQATSELKQYCYREQLPVEANNVIIDMAVVKYNLLGTEGLSSQSYSGLNEEYAYYQRQLINSFNLYSMVKTLLYDVLKMVRYTGV